MMLKEERKGCWVGGMVLKEGINGMGCLDREMDGWIRCVWKNI